MADHPEVQVRTEILTIFIDSLRFLFQEKVLQEQKDLFGEEKNPVITYSELQNMKYLEHVIKESCRLYPPVPEIGRCTTEDIEFGTFLEKRQLLNTSFQI